MYDLYPLKRCGKDPVCLGNVCSLVSHGNQFHTPSLCGFPDDAQKALCFVCHRFVFSKLSFGTCFESKW